MREKSKYFSFNTCSWCIRLSSESKMVCSCVPFDFYCGDCIDKVVIHIYIYIYIHYWILLYLFWRLLQWKIIIRGLMNLMTLSRHFSQSFIASGRSSGLHPVSSHSCCMYVQAGRPAFAWPYAGVHRSTSLMSSSLLLQQCPACLVRLTCTVFVMGGRWPYSWCLVGCFHQDLFNIARNILV